MYLNCITSWRSLITDMCSSGSLTRQSISICVCRPAALSKYSRRLMCRPQALEQSAAQHQHARMMTSMQSSVPGCNQAFEPLHECRPQVHLQRQQRQIPARSLTLLSRLLRHRLQRPGLLHSICGCRQLLLQRQPSVLGPNLPPRCALLADAIHCLLMYIVYECQTGGGVFGL